MIALDACYEYAVPGLLVTAELLGRRLAIPGTAVSVLFPADPDDDPHGLNRWFNESDPIEGGGIFVDGTRVAVTARTIIIAVRGEHDVEPTEPEAVSLTLGTSMVEATTHVSRLMEWLRTDRKLRLASRSRVESARLVSTHLRRGDESALHYGSLHVGMVLMRTSEHALTLAQAEALLARLAASDEPKLWESFLADADSASDVTHGVLLAAVACEVAIKTHLSESATDEQSKLVDLLLSRPRDFSMAAASLWDKPSSAVLGRSLREEDPALYARVDRLFEDRNRIAHKALAGLRAEQELRNEIAAAREAVDWLQSR